VNRGLLLGLAIAIAGCGAKLPPEEKLMKERIDTLEEMIGELEKVTNKSSMDRASLAFRELSAKLTRLNEEFKALPEELKQKANSSVLSQKMEEVTARLRAAKAKAFQASANP